jgi:hypothetical protein
MDDDDLPPPLEQVYRTPNPARGQQKMNAHPQMNSGGLPRRPPSGLNRNVPPSRLGTGGGSSGQSQTGSTLPRINSRGGMRPPTNSS